MRESGTAIFRRSIFIASLLLLTAAPAHAGVINIEFNAVIFNAGGPLGVRDDELTGLITIDLVDIADQDPSPDSALFADGQIAVSDLGFADAVMVELFTAEGNSRQTPAGQRVSVIGPGGSVELRVNNGADGDSVSLMVRGFRGPFDNTITEISLAFGGIFELLTGNETFNDNLPGLEALLLSYDPDQASGGSAVFGSGSVRSVQQSQLRITDVSITSAAQQVPEPGQLGLLALCLLLVRSGAAFRLRKLSNPSAA